MHAQTETITWQLRLLNGPLRGTVQPLSSRLTIGRAASSDLQLVDEAVSRQHAHIVETESGEHLLIDLSSINGTFVDHQRIERTLLRPNTIITIAHIELAYERVTVARGTTPPRPSVLGRRSDIQTMRGTTELRVVEDAPEARLSIEADEDDRFGLDEALGKGPSGTPSLAAASTPDEAPPQFERPDGSLYDGHLIADIIEYRTLRAQNLRGALADPILRQQFEALRERLRQPPGADPPFAQRAFCRFLGWCPAELQLSSGERRACHVRDLGVDGAQLALPAHGLAPDAIVWLSLSRHTPEASKQVVLTGRVAWADDEFLGLSFSGAPTSNLGRYAESPGAASREALLDARTIRIPLERISLALSGRWPLDDD